MKSKHIFTQVWGITEAKDWKWMGPFLKLALSISYLSSVRLVLSPCVAILKVFSYFIKVQIIFTGLCDQWADSVQLQCLSSIACLITAHEQTQLNQVLYINSYLAWFPCFQRFSFSELTVFLSNAFSSLSLFYFLPLFWIWICTTKILLTHICLVDLTTLFSWTSPFPILGMSGVFFYSYFIFDRISC